MNQASLTTVFRRFLAVPGPSCPQSRLHSSLSSPVPSSLVSRLVFSRLPSHLRASPVVFQLFQGGPPQ